VDNRTGDHAAALVSSACASAGEIRDEIHHAFLTLAAVIIC
jgi:hypothetical protein